ncbi:hypothetical protein ACPXCJ_29155 [Micromonospora chalcea]|uniref:hypothetical protein n=1 Tax=Micromonospora chalcea TaxID=1874 RepID=UPI003CE70ECC
MEPAYDEAVPEVLNLTPHVVRLIGDSATVEVAPAGPPARLVLLPDRADGAVRIGPLLVPLKRTAASSDVVGLPDARPGVLLIVARPVAEAFPERDDLLYPHDTVRDADGAVVGCRSLARPVVAADD